MLTAVKSGDYERAEELRLDAYLVFEVSLESRLESRNHELKEEIEGMFWEGSAAQPGLATLIAAQAPTDQVVARTEHLSEEMEEARGFLGSTMTPLIAFLNSMAIIIREGLEAVLIIGAILGYMKATKREGRYSLWVLLGVVVAVILSLGIWVASNTLFHVTAANRELFEGIVSLIAVAVLFYVTNWLFHRVYVIDWMTFVKEEVGKALRAGSLFGLAFLSFTVVFREGFETVLFYQALSFDAPPTMLFGGFAVGMAIIVAIAYIILKLSGRIPIKRFFTATSIMMLILAFSFSGMGIRALQEAGVVSISPLAIIPQSDLLSGTLGIFPTWETILAQIAFLLLIGATFAINRWHFTVQQAKKAQANG
jgi:high-affinity iron transporter